MTDSKIERCSCPEAECYRAALERIVRESPTTTEACIAADALASVESESEYRRRNP